MPESPAHMVSEYVRELAVLIIVFVPLDYLLKGDDYRNWAGYVTVVVLSLSLLGLGILIEQRRTPS